MDFLDPISLLFGLSTTPLELFSFLLALVTVLLSIRLNHWAWLFSIMSSALYAIVFLYARLYGDMGLQCVFIAVSLWGWCQWLFAGEARQPLSVSRLSRSGWTLSLLLWFLGFVSLSLFLRSYTNTDVPWADGFLTAGSLVGQYLLSQKRLENWWCWIIVDLLYVGLYLYKHLHLTAVLYGVFVILAIAGWRTWSRNEVRHKFPA